MKADAVSPKLWRNISTLYLFSFCSFSNTTRVWWLWKASKNFFHKSIEGGQNGFFTNYAENMKNFCAQCEKIAPPSVSSWTKIWLLSPMPTSSFLKDVRDALQWRKLSHDLIIFLSVYALTSHFWKKLKLKFKTQIFRWTYNGFINKLYIGNTMALLDLQK